MATQEFETIAVGSVVQRDCFDLARSGWLTADAGLMIDLAFPPRAQPSFTQDQHSDGTEDAARRAGKRFEGLIIYAIRCLLMICGREVL